MLHRDTANGGIAPPARRGTATASLDETFLARLRVWFFICLNSPAGWEALG
jgi:hypothetical protein